MNMIYIIAMALNWLVLFVCWIREYKRAEAWKETADFVNRVNDFIADTAVKREKEIKRLKGMIASGETADGWKASKRRQKMKIYIAGSIKNDPHYLEKFCEAEQFLRALGHTVINPARNPDGLSYKEYIDLGLKQLSMCDAIFILQGYEISSGATLEEKYAHTVGNDLIYDTEAVRRSLENYCCVPAEEKQSVPWEAD